MNKKQSLWQKIKKFFQSEDVEGEEDQQEGTKDEDGNENVVIIEEPKESVEIDDKLKDIDEEEIEEVNDAKPSNRND